MRIVLQRVSEASVRVAGREVARIGRGLLLLVGIGRGDDEDELRFWSRKIPELRVFPDDDGRMNRSLRDVGGRSCAYLSSPSTGTPPRAAALGSTERRRAARPLPCTRRSSPGCARRGVPSRAACSERGWRSPSSTTGR